MNYQNKIFKKNLSFFLSAGIIALGGFFIFPGQASAINQGDIIINEFVSNPSTGNEWVELLNTTEFSINLAEDSGWTIQDSAQENPQSLSGLGVIPPNGIVVLENGSDWLSDDPGTETITIFDNTGTPIHSVSYGSDSEVNVVSPQAGESAYLASLPSTWNVTATPISIPSKGWFNDAGEPDKAPLLGDIDLLLANNAGIDSNIGELDNPSATPTDDLYALYFEKSDMGKIIFTASLNLTDQATIAVLQSLGAAMEMSAGHIKFDTATAEAMAATGAKIYMYGLNALGYTSTPNILVKDDEGNILGTNDPTALGDISYNADTGVLLFTALHFTQFDIEALPSTVLIDSSDPSDISGAFTPKISSTLDIGHSAYIGRATTFTGPALGEDGNTIKWQVTISGPSMLTNDMVDLDEVGFINNTNGDDFDSDSLTYHYPFQVELDENEEETGNLIVTGSCNQSVEDGETHSNGCENANGFSLNEDENGEFINADKIIFNSSAPFGDYIITYNLINTETNEILETYEVSVEVVKTAITVTADSKSKNYGNIDPELTYQITSGSLIEGDSFSGALTRDAGEDIGEYAITQDTLALNSNYILTFIPAVLTINFNDIIALTEAGKWTLVSAPTLLNETPTITDDEDGAVALLVYENGEFVTPSENNENIIKPVNAFYVKTTNTGKVKFKYANITSPTQTSKQLTTGWNLVGTNNDGSAQNEFSSIQNTPTNSGMVTLFVSDIYNARKNFGYISWGEDANQDLNANPITELPENNNISKYDGYWIFMNAAKEFVKQISS